MRRPPSASVASVAVALILLTACGSAADDAAQPGGPATGSAPGSAPVALAGEITVFAAASLTEAFEALGTAFEQEHPNASITFNFGPSSGLAAQITAGAPADVFASASPASMDTVIAADAALAPTVFAANSMAIAVPPDNPADITTLSDLAKNGVKVALCQPDVPCGAAAAEVFANADLTVTPITLETDVKAALTKVVLGEVDAGVVYATDVQAAGGKVAGITIPASLNASTRYPIAPLAESAHPDLAQAFVDFVLSADGASVLTAAGFQQP